MLPMAVTSPQIGGKMKKTEFTACVSSGMNNYNGTWRRVYTDGEKFYIKTKDGYICISGTEAEKMMVRD